MEHTHEQAGGPEELLGRAVPHERRAVPPGAVLAVAAFGAFLAFLDSTIVNIAFPDIQRDFADADLSRLSWVLNSYNIVFAAFLVVAGRLADLLGRRRLFTGGVVVFTVASVLCAVAPGVDALIAFRVLQALGAAALVPASLAVVVEAFPPGRRAHAVGLWGASAALAAGLGPPVGGALVELSGWRLAFLVNLPLGVLAVVVASRGLVESRAPGRRLVPDLPGATLLAVALALLTTSLVKAEDWGWAGGRTLLTTALGLLALAGFVVSSRRSPSPVLDPALLRVRSFVVANVVTLVASAGFYAYLLTHVLWLYYVWDYSLLRAGLALAPAALVAAVAAAVLGRVVDRYGARVVALPGAVVWAGALAWYLTQVGTSPAFLTEWLPGQLVAGIGVGATLPVVGAAAVAGVTSSAYASASAVVSATRQFGAVLGVALLVVVVGTPTPLTAVDALRDGWAFSVACLAVAACGVLLLRPDPPAPEVDDAVPELPGQRAPTPAPLPPRPSLPAPSGDVLADTPLFAGLSPAALARVRRSARPVELPAGEELFRQGDPADALYVVQAGQVEVLRDGEVVSRLGRGASFGELGLLGSGTRAATVRARRDSRLLRVSRTSFTNLGAAEPALLQAVTQTLAGWLTSSRPPSRGSRPVVVSVVALDADAPVEQVARRLEEHLAPHLHVVLPGRVDAVGLERAERSADRVLLVAGTGDVEDPWRAFCLRQADRVVLVGSAAAPLSRAALPPERGADLVLVGRRPRREAVQAWHDALAPTTCAYVQGSLGDGVRALAARLAGRSVGLVLGGGGARAFAHLGVLDELHRADIVVDRYAGSSLGALVAAGCATGMSPDQLDAVCYEHFVRRNPSGDWTVPVRALTRGRRTLRALESFFGDVLVEELPHELAVVSVDLLARERVVHRRGRVAEVTAASMRVPVLTPPLLLDGRLHVDGGLLDNLPVDVLKARDEGPVLAVAISFGSGSGGASGRTPRVPGLGDTLMRSLTLGSGPATANGLAAADLVVRPASRGVGLLEWHQLDTVREAGREAAREALAGVDGQLRPLVPAPEQDAPPLPIDVRRARPAVRAPRRAVVEPA